MKFIENEGLNGEPPKSVTVTGIEFLPLSYKELANARPGNPIIIPLNWRNARVVETNIEGVDIGQPYKGKTTLESIFSCSTVGLQRGGWLPSGLAITRSDVMVLPDRNVISQMKGRFDDGKAVGAGRDLLDLFAGQKVRINPLFYAIEGNSRSIPTPEAVKAQLGEAIAFVGKALPEATIIANDGNLKGALGLIEDTRDGLSRKQEFLLDLTPHLSPPTSFRQLDSRWSAILAAADRHHVPRNSLIVLAALSAVAVPNSGSPAKKLLKPRAGYSINDAYNALADIRSLEILVNLFALFPDERAVFLRQTGLSLFFGPASAHLILHI